MIELRGSLIKAWRVALHVPLARCARAAGSKSYTRYLDCENEDHRPPHGWEAVVGVLAFPLAVHLKRSPSDLPGGFTWAQARWIVEQS